MHSTAYVAVPVTSHPRGTCHRVPSVSPCRALRDQPGPPLSCAWTWSGINQFPWQRLPILPSSLRDPCCFPSLIFSTQELLPCLVPAWGKPWEMPPRAERSWNCVCQFIIYSHCLQWGYPNEQVGGGGGEQIPLWQWAFAQTIQKPL